MVHNTEVFECSRNQDSPVRIADVTSALLSETSSAMESVGASSARIAPCLIFARNPDMEIRPVPGPQVQIHDTSHSTTKLGLASVVAVVVLFSEKKKTLSRLNISCD